MRYNYPWKTFNFKLLKRVWQGSAFEAGFGSADAGQEGGRAQRVRVVEKAGEEGRHGVVRDAKAGRDDVEVHDGLGDEE